MSARRVLLFVVLPLLFLATLGGKIFYFLSSPRDDLVTPDQLASIPLPTEPSLLAWSADGNYIAAGTGYTNGLVVDGPAKVFLIDVSRQAVAATVDTAERVNGLAFSPDGKWLAAATWLVSSRDKVESEPAELVVFMIPDLTVKLRAKSRPKHLAVGQIPGWFVDIAWAPDSKTVHAIDGGLGVRPQFRRWMAPDFVEQPAFSYESSNVYDAIAVAPDSRSLCFVQWRPAGTGLLHLFDLATGTKTISIENIPSGRYRAAFTADGKSVGVFSGIPWSILDANQVGKRQTMSWWDVATGQPATPVNPRFAVQPAAQAESRYYSIAPDSRIWAHSLLYPALFLQHGKDGGIDRDGHYVTLIQTDTTKTWRWRFGNMPSLAFSPDSTKLAGTLKTEGGWTVAIWTVP